MDPLPVFGPLPTASTGKETTVIAPKANRLDSDTDTTFLFRFIITFLPYFIE